MSLLLKRWGKSVRLEVYQLPAWVAGLGRGGQRDFTGDFCTEDTWLSCWCCLMISGVTCVGSLDFEVMFYRKVRWMTFLLWLLIADVTFNIEFRIAAFKYVYVANLSRWKP
jgi:hypothetical protein